MHFSGTGTGIVLVMHFTGNKLVIDFTGIVPVMVFYWYSTGTGVAFFWYR